MKSDYITLGILTLILAGGIYWYFFTNSNNQAPLTATALTQNDAQTQFQTLLGELRSISFNTSIFSDQRFAALVDLSTPVAPEPPGRLDPFASVPGITGK